MSNSYTKTVYQAPNGTWSWSVLDAHQQPVVRGDGYANQNAADIAAANELCTQRVVGGELRSDGETMTGIAAYDNDACPPLDADLY